MTLLLQYQGQTGVPVEIEGFVPNVVREMSLEKIEKFEIFHGNRKLPLAEMFTVSGDPSDCQMRFEGDLSGVHWIGAHMTEGQIQIAGNGGRHIGSEMSGGRITVDGDAGDWVGGEMQGGMIHVHGRAGHLIGAAYRGSPRGMTGGTILVDGVVGNELGLTMRRGLIAVGGCGDVAGFNMLAGSILVFGPCGIRHGAGMKRGTIGLFGPEPPPMLPTFRRACRYEPQALHLLLTSLRRCGYKLDDAMASAEVDLYNGDFLEGGRGEILVAVGS